MLYISITETNSKIQSFYFLKTAVSYAEVLCMITCNKSRLKIVP